MMRVNICYRVEVVMMEESDDDESRRDDMLENKSEGGYGVEED